MLLSCGNSTQEVAAAKQGYTPTNTMEGITIFTATDNCQYVLYRGLSSATAMVHSGNCHNPIHKHE